MNFAAFGFTTPETRGRDTIMICGRDTIMICAAPACLPDLMPREDRVSANQIVEFVNGNAHAATGRGATPRTFSAQTWSMGTGGRRSGPQWSSSPPAPEPKVKR